VVPLASGCRVKAKQKNKGFYGVFWLVRKLAMIK